MADSYQLPSSFVGGMEGAVKDLKSGNLPQAQTSPVKKTTGIKQTSLPQKKKTYKITFDNGATVDFGDKQPTQQDVEEAYAQVKAYKKPETPIFQDKFKEEGVIEQTLKSIPRALADTGKQIYGNLTGMMDSGANVINSGISNAYKGVTGKQLPGFGTAETGFTEQKDKYDFGKNASQFAANATGLATQATPVGLATNVGFNLASNLPGVQYVPQGISAGIEGAANIASDITGIDPEITNNLAMTGLNALFLKSSLKQGKPISDAYNAGGQTAALAELSKSVPRTTIDIAKQPISLVTVPAKLTGKLIDYTIGKTAQGLLTNKTGTQELFQASSPSINKLANKNLSVDKIKEKAALADDTVVRAGYKPKNSTERVEAYKGAMQDVWKQIEEARGGQTEHFSGKQMGDFIRAKIQESKVNGKMSPSQIKDAKLLNDWATYYESLGNVDFPTLSSIRTQINGETTWNKKLDNGDLFNKTFQDLAAVVRKTENNVIDASAKVPGSKFQDLMNRYGALTTLLEDVVKQDIKVQRQKGDGLISNYSRLEGAGDVIKGTIGLIKDPVTGAGNIASGAGKILLGKTLAKLKDTDFLIENGYKKLSKSLGLDKKGTKLPTKRTFSEPEGLKPIDQVKKGDTSKS